MFPENAEKVVLATTALSNFIKLNDNAKKYCPKTCIDWEDEHYNIHNGEFRNEVSPLRSSRLGSNNSTRAAQNLRNQLAEYFCGEGAVPFQYDKLN